MELNSEGICISLLASHRSHRASAAALEVELPQSLPLSRLALPRRAVLPRALPPRVRRSCRLGAHNHLGRSEALERPLTWLRLQYSEKDRQHRR